MDKEKILKIVKSKVFLGVVCFILGGAMMSDSEGTIKLEEKVKTLNESVTKAEAEKVELEAKVKDFEAKNKELQVKVDEAKPWFDMAEDERKAEEERIAKEKAEKEAEEKAKKEAEEKAKKEAEEKAKKEAEEKKKAEEQAKKEAEAKKYDTGITFNDLARNPSNYILQYVKFEGKIVQVMKGDGYVQYRMAVNGDYDQMVLIEINNSMLSGGNVLEDDYIYIKGQFVMETSYETVLGAQMTIPAIVVDEFSY